MTAHSAPRRDDHPLTVLVTGGGGFIGKAVIQRLIARGWAVRNLSRHHYPELDALGVTTIPGDLADPDVCRRACAGCAAIIHVAAKAGVWGPYREYERPNVIGTQNLLAACDQRVRWFVFTSSPSVVFGGHDMAGVDESVPYPAQHRSAYSATKAQAERAVLAANRPALRTVALRPHLVWGPGDNHIVPRILAQARAGQLRIIGPGDNQVDTTYIDNAADAHLCALDALRTHDPSTQPPDANQSPRRKPRKNTPLTDSPGKQPAESPRDPAGKAYFISNGEPIVLWDIINGILAAAGEPPITRKVNRRLALTAAGIMEMSHRLLGRAGEPRLTRFVVEEMTSTHWFDISAARRDLGYHPRVTIAEGLEKLRAHLAK
jgi:nucleoside-diphosphate-sugar epimerase